MKKLAMPFLILSLIAVLILQTGCGVKMRQKSSRAEEMPTPAAARTTPVTTTTLPPATPPYRLGFGDVLEIKFFNNREFNETVPVRPDGRIAIEKVGEIEVAGHTVAYVDSIITQTYAQFVRNPDVTVIVREFGNNQVYVLGEVNAPGKFAIQQEMTVLQAVANAGGPKDTAKLNSVMLIRKNGNAAPVVSRVNLKKVERQHAADGSAVNGGALFVEPQDVIYVPKTFFADVGAFMSQVYSGLLPPIDAYLRALFYTTR